MDQQKKKTNVGLVIVLVLIGIVLFGAAGTMAFGFKHFSGFENRGSFKMTAGRGMMGGREGFREFGGEKMLKGRLSGQITTINDNGITLKTSSGDEVQVAILETTSIYNQGKIAKQSDLKVNNSVIVSGRPNSSGLVQAVTIMIQ